MRKIKFNQSVKEALTLSMLRDKKVVLMGLGVTDPKGIFGTTKDLGKKFGSTRVIETPTSENAITGIALGAAIALGTWKAKYMATLTDDGLLL